MSCQETQRLIHPYLDCELDLVRSLEIEAHLKDCQTCAQAHNELRILHSSERHRPALSPPGGFA